MHDAPTALQCGKRIQNLHHHHEATANGLSKQKTSTARDTTEIEETGDMIEIEIGETRAVVKPDHETMIIEIERGGGREVEVGNGRAEVL